MRIWKAAVAAVVVLAASPAMAVTMGTWDSSPGGGLDGVPLTWTEAYGPGGPGSPGSALTADGIYWTILGPEIPAGGGPTAIVDAGAGTVTYITDYLGGELALFFGPWGIPEPDSFFDVMLTVTAVKDLATGAYLDGSVVGTAFGGGMMASFEATGLTEVFDVPGPGGFHFGEIEYVKLAITPEPVTMVGLALGLGGLARYVRRRR